MSQPIFHLAFPVKNLTQTRSFYVNGLGCQEGRATQNSLILGLYGHQLVAHVTREDLAPQAGIYPRHFGLVFLQAEAWDALLHRSQAYGLTFRQPAKTRFLDSPLEHRTFFLQDPFFNLLEFKYYSHPSAILGETAWAQVGDAIADGA